MLDDEPLIVSNDERIKADDKGKTEKFSMWPTFSSNKDDGNKQGYDLPDKMWWFSWVTFLYN